MYTRVNAPILLLLGTLSILIYEQDCTRVFTGFARFLLPELPQVQHVHNVLVTSLCLLPSQVASARADKTFPACESDNPEELVKPMLDWANGGFLPKGEEGLKPTLSAGKQGCRVWSRCVHQVAHVSGFLQRAALWTRSLMFPCQSISPVQSGPKSVPVRIRLFLRSLTAEVEVKTPTFPGPCIYPVTFHVCYNY